MFDINVWELLMLGVLAIIVLGPERLPEYAAKFGKLIREARGFADRARQQLKDEMGPEFSEVDWKAYDPRQYDPRKIVRDALSGTDDDDELDRNADKAVSTPKGHDPLAPTPWDSEAT